MELQETGAGFELGGLAPESRLLNASGRESSIEAVRYQESPQVDRQPCLGQRKLRRVPRTVWVQKAALRKWAWKLEVKSQVGDLLFL